ncbi:MAG: hypothetical protein AAGU04_09265 [Anaerolineaceae bacterium]
MNKQDLWMRRRARPLDLARWNFLQGRAGSREVLDALAAFQNADGGFGHGLEPDFWNPNSSPMQSWRATLVLREIGCFDPGEALIRALKDYLLRTCEAGKWQALLPSNDDYPHAPWWHYRADQEFWGYNPGAALLGFLAQVGVLLEPEIHLALGCFLGQTEAQMHELPRFLDLYTDLRAVGWNGAELLAVREKLVEDLRKAVVTDPARWSEYVLRPSMVFSAENREFHAPFAQVIRQEKTWLGEHVEEDGSWEISWQWGQYPEAFAVAREWWKGGHIVTYARFLMLED